MHLRYLASTLAASATLLAILAPGRARAATDCELHLVASIPATLSKHNQLLLDTVINDVPAKIELDTGTSVSILFKKFAQRAGLTIENMQGVVFGLTGQPLNEMTHVRSLQLGNKTSPNEAFALSPIGGDGTDDGPVGLFGSDYLQNYDVEIDVAGGKVNLFQQQHCADHVVYWAPEFFKSKIYYAGTSTAHRPMMDIAIDGKPLHALLDTGATATFMRMAVARDRFDLSPDSPDMIPAGETSGIEGRKLDSYRHSFQTLAFGDITLHNPKVVIVPIDTAAHVEKSGSHIKVLAAEEPDVMIGMTLLKQLHLYLSFSENALYYTVASAPKQAATQ